MESIKKWVLRPHLGLGSRVNEPRHPTNWRRGFPIARQTKTGVPSFKGDEAGLNAKPQRAASYA